MRTLILLLLTTGISLMAQPAEIMNAAEIKLGIKKLGVLGSVLYLAAHPGHSNLLCKRQRLSFRLPVPDTRARRTEPYRSGKGSLDERLTNT